MSVAEETRQIVALLERVDKVESVAASLPPNDDRRTTLTEVVEQSLEAAPPVRPIIAAELMQLSDKTVRAWTAEGVLTADDSQPAKRLLLSMRRLHDVLHVLRQVRAEGRTTGLLDEVYRRLADATWLEREDFAESLAQVRARQGKLRAAKSTS